ncbi:hypothetical protein DRO41_00675 [Candidatus Bathyarchaeota archaeon]|nr:MAG: hypothetical protein DRO41_00675 [Candidatus Bathyarchaeota archaeon]
MNREKEEFEEFGMFSSEGEEKVKELINHIKRELRAGIEKIAKEGHGEIYDSAVRDAILDELADCFR